MALLVFQELKEKGQGQGGMAYLDRLDYQVLEERWV
jgi:hypothetical protein